MAIVTPPSKVLVTGANGFIAVWIVRFLLEQGYAVRGTVRTDSKAKYLKERFAQHGSKLEVLVIPDMTAKGAFDESVKDVQGILHTAAPVITNGTYETVVTPSVDMTENILLSALKYGNELRRITVTSSVVTLMQPHEPGYTFTDKDWNEYALQELKDKGDKAAPHIFYFASKTLAERAAWKFYEEHKAEVKWDLETILFPYVFGPKFHEEYSNGKAQSFLYSHLEQQKLADTLGDAAGAWADVRDVALGHILSLQKEGAAGKRLIISAGGFAWQDVYDALATAQPKLEGIPKGTPGVPRKAFSIPDASKTNELLGMTYHSLAESARDTVLSVRSPGSF
ncbi:NAD-binding protein [Calocera viscosa TUFC12733]|uniref:NAD-binding protein n=1 Tax=Calocera viscosa (strain TUFC12733) TaxID=1330018 RepID=A0A167G6P5_CALVF|nr:NAD-binding protein [Calocera viscosa TUFC12733]